MVKLEHYLCDHCGNHFQPNATEGVTNVALTVGGNGAAKDTFNSDLCRECYGKLITDIRYMFSTRPTDATR
jgi:hypothetical protein